MKNIYTLSILLVLSLSSFAKPFYIYTAKKSGYWDNSATWNMVLRNDNVQKDKFIIPAAYKVTANQNVNTLGYTDVELQISGILELGPSTELYFGNNSKIEILATGSIDATGASQQIFIGAVSKYIGNTNKILSGPLYADYSTGIAPLGFTAYSLLALPTTTSVTSSRENQNNEATVIYASNKNLNIVFKKEIRTTVSVKVLNMNGNIVATASFNHPSSKVNVNMSQLSVGIYVVQVINNNQTTVTKVAIN